MNKVIPALWFTDKAEEAARFYCSLLPDSHIDSVQTMPAESPSGPPGSVHVIDFTLCGQQFQAMQAGPLDSFNHAVSFIINCDSQEELDRLWDALLDGGEPEMCGWLKDRYGLSWQIVPTILAEWTQKADEASGKRLAEEVLRQQKFDIAALKAAYEG
jgi:predicted 3-demethylubiquinone-9 3-methyltransferase (glyoxalase superfamily)